jgi:Mg-chelatase subunit ChlD
MNCSSFYTQVQDDPSILRNGGIILKGKSRLERQPVHMMLAVDTSGSMAHEGKLSSVKKSIHLLLSLLSPEDRLSLVTFSDDSKTFLNRVIPTNEERQAIQYRINNLVAEGSTNMSAGLLELRGLVEPPSSSQTTSITLTRKQGLVLLTDGHANMGVHTEQGLVEILQRIQSESPGLSLTTVAYGVEHNAEMLTNLAKVGGGAYNVVTNLEDVASVFGDILGSLMSVSAQKVEVQLPPGAEAFTSFRTQKDAAGVTTVYVGDLYADVEVTILFKSSPSNGPLRIKATDMATLDLIDTSGEPTLLTDLQAVPVALTMAEYRQKTIALLAAVRSGSSSGSRSITQIEIEALLTEIQGDQRIREHPLTAILLEDLQQALQMSRRGCLTQQETIEVTQHSAYLGMSRGLRSTTSHVPPLRRQVAVNTLRNFSGDPISPPTSPILAPHNITSPFANRIQSQMATVMRTMSSQPEDESQ